MGPALLKNIVSELNILLAGGVISKVHQPNERDLILKVFSRGREHSLLISTRPLCPRLHLTRRKYENPATPKRLCAFLRSRITDARIQGISVPEGERVVSIALSKGFGDAREDLALIAELTGKSSNVILVDSDMVVLDALRHFKPDESPRAVVPGTRLMPLPSPHLIRDEELPQKDDGASWNEAADIRYSRDEDEVEEKALRSRLGRAVNEARKRATRLSNNLNRDREKALWDLDKSRTGELLAANFTLLKKGMNSIEVEDFYKTPPEKTVIPLDERLGPKDNVARCFKLARKARACLELLKERLPEIASELEYIEGLGFELDAAKDMDGLDLIRDELSRAGYLKEPRPPAREKKRPVERAEPVTRLETRDGLVMLAGKSGIGNDLIVRKYASPDDLWFHAKDSPGAHVLLKGIGKPFPQASITEAARLAARNSRLSAQSKAEVMYTEAKNLKKPRGAKPGMVRVSAYRTIMVKPGPD